MACRKLKFADLFCGAGGTTTGAESTGGAECEFAVNHWSRAIETHSANHPHAKHSQHMLHEVGPAECPKINLLFASPSCTHHSRARGGKPTSDQQRSGAWEVMPWLDHHRPSFMVIENVPEFRDWGPVGADGRPLVSGKGKLFDSWMKAVESHGYRCEVGILNAADFGAATSRSRLFVIARKGRRSAPFPEPTHARNPARALPGMERDRWRPAAEIIDWSISCPSLFSRSRPLADKTLARIEAGLRKFVGPYAVHLRNNMTAGTLESPLLTITAGGGHHGVAVPYQYQLIGNGAGRSRGIEQVLPTIVAARENHGVVMPYLVPNFGERAGQCPRTHDLNHPAPAITGHGAGGLVVPFLSQYYGTGEGSAVGSPLPTIVTKDRHALVQARIDPCCLDWPVADTEAMRSLQATMRSMGVADIGFRMLQNHELAAAQGFPANYVFAGTKAEVTKQIGNSVSPPVAAAITRTILSV